MITNDMLKLKIELENAREQLRTQYAVLHRHEKELADLKKMQGTLYLVIDPHFICEDKRVIAVFDEPLKAHQAMHSVSDELLVVPVSATNGNFYTYGSMEPGDRLWIVSIEIDTGDVAHSILGSYSALKLAGKLLFSDVQSCFAGNVVDIYVLAATRAAAHIEAKELYGSMPSVMQLPSSWEAFEGPVSLAEIEDYFDRVF